MEIVANVAGRPNISNEVLDENGRFTSVWYRFMEQMWVRSGGSVDDVSGLRDAIELVELIPTTEDISQDDLSPPIVEKEVPDDLSPSIVEKEVQDDLSPRFENPLNDVIISQSFTPVLTGSTSGTFNGEGRFTLLGDMVFCEVRFAGITTANKPIGNYSITGFPLTSASNGTIIFVGIISPERVTVTGTGVIQILLGQGTTTATLEETFSNALTTALTDANFVNGGTMFLNGELTYRKA